MLERIKRNEKSIFDDPIAKILTELETYDPTDPEYRKLLKYLAKLTELKTQSRREKVKMDTIILVAGNILVTLIIVGYERNHAILSKGFDFIRKPKN